MTSTKTECKKAILENDDVQLLQTWLTCVIFEVRRVDGNKYPPKAVMQPLCTMWPAARSPTSSKRNRFCVACSVGSDVIKAESPPSSLIWHTVASDRFTEGVRQVMPRTIPTRHRNNYKARCSFKGGEDTLWEKGVIGTETSLQLLRAVVLYSVVNCALKDGEDQINQNWNGKKR